ncbi:uncharacterized protein LOC6732461 [Drosophila simulans]|uniref:Uncharacterized protein n=1 Tax=Drosophila simulans TaxID=7240 RepID=A0A0J9R2Y4_DROSI|nr:uncharacterized protein LOC6732461 [Drosophila simulans]KMY90418.1 uncharacterized protein Dsimw501_GD21937 [Drosophila simulans]
MSPKFALAILLLSCVLLGLTNAQYNRRHQAGPYRQNIGMRMNSDGSLPPPPADNAGGSDVPANVDCMPNLLASNTLDTRKPRPKH